MLDLVVQVGWKIIAILACGVILVWQFLLPAVSADAVDAKIPAPLTTSSLQSQESVNISRRGLDGVLRDLGKKFDFKIIGVEKLRADQTIAGPYKGNIENILEKVLRNRNYMIVRSTHGLKKITRLVILDLRIGAKSGPGPGRASKVRRRRKKTN